MLSTIISLLFVSILFEKVNRQLYVFNCYCGTAINYFTHKIYSRLIKRSRKWILPRGSVVDLIKEVKVLII